MSPIAGGLCPTDSAGEGQPRSAGRSRTKSHTRMAITMVKTPTATKERRQPIQLLRRARGVAAVREPRPPMTMRIAVIVANSLTRNHSASTFMVGTKSMATPSPTRVRPMMAQKAEGAKPKRMEPMVATLKNRVMDRRGPHESERRPAGSCMRAYG